MHKFLFSLYKKMSDICDDSQSVSIEEFLATRGNQDGNN